MQKDDLPEFDFTSEWDPQLEEIAQTNGLEAILRIGIEQGIKLAGVVKATRLKEQ